MNLRDFNRVLDTLGLENKMSMEDFDQLGTEIIYSQQDVVKLLKNMMARLMGRINKELNKE